MSPHNVTTARLQGGAECNSLCRGPADSKIGVFSLADPISWLNKSSKNKKMADRDGSLAFIAILGMRNCASS